jgi:hypothetical protein
MMVFSLLSIKNIREFQRRIHPRTQIPIIALNGQDPSQNIANKKKYDYQLSFMVLIQQFFLSYYKYTICSIFILFCNNIILD